MRNERDEGKAPPTQGTEPPLEEEGETERADTEKARDARADKAVSPYQPTYPPPPPEGTETTEPVKKEDLPGS